jgi:hypothetical protein
VTTAAQPHRRQQKQWYNHAMKKVDRVLDHLLANPLYARLRTHGCFRQLQSALPEPLRRGILFMYVKNRTLFIALKHPAFKMEIDYKLSTIKNLLSTLPPLKEACGEFGIDRIKTFVSRYAPPPRPPEDTVPRYKEHATGRFAITTKDEALQKRFAQIRDLIRMHHDA